jgi:glycosyltransferase involved in cell wall biosynthesis
MKVLMAHSFYQRPGGEDKCFEAESNLLRSRGHDLSTYTLQNDELSHMSGLKAAGTALWNGRAHKELSALIRAQRPEVVHIHNSFPLMSPSAIWAAKSHGCAVVTTLHNYRLLCPLGTLVRDGRVCEDCVGRAWPWPGIVHGCYRNSRPASAAVANMLLAHRVLRTWSHKVDTFIALSNFARQKFVEGGIPDAKIALKPNFVDPDPGPSETSRGYALFAGRLSPEKGIETLLEAWKRPVGGMKLRILGGGPLSRQVEAAASRSPNIDYLGYRQTADVMELMAGANFLVMPSLCYETFGLAIIEAFAKAKPVIVSRLGTCTELVEDGRTGLHIEAGNPDDLAAKVTWASAHQADMRAMGKNARAVYDDNYSAGRNYDRIMEIYGSALASARRENP